MKRANRGWLWRFALGAVAVVCMSAILPAADRQKGNRANSRPHADEVELFAGIEQGKLDVKLIPQDDMKCRLLITNKTDKPLSVKMPASFAGVPVLPKTKTDKPLSVKLPDSFAGLPVLAQMGLPMPPMKRDPFAPPQADPKAPQRVAGGPGPGLGHGLANIAPEAMRTLKLETVCLDYGHPRPRPELKYEILPVSAATDKAGVAEICEMLGRGEISHRAPQLAAWHFSNDIELGIAGRTADQAGHRHHPGLHQGRA